MEEAQLAWVWLSETGRACACVSGRRVSVGPLTTMMYMDGRVDGDIGYGRCVCGLITHQTCVRLRSLSVDVSVDVHTDVSVESLCECLYRCICERVDGDMDVQST